MVSHLKFWSHNLHSWCDRIVVLGFSVLFFSQFECKVIQSSHNLVNPSLWILSLRISHIWRFWVLEDLESSTKKNSVKISSQFLKFSVFRAQFSGSHFGNSQFRSEISFRAMGICLNDMDKLKLKVCVEKFQFAWNFVGFRDGFLEHAPQGRACRSFYFMNKGV